MASLDLDDNQSAYQIKGYKPGLLQINEQRYTESVIVTATQLISDWFPQTVAELTKEAFAPILTLRPTILLIGTGSQLIFLPTDLYGELINHGIGVEIMDTSAASRTFNALTAENREVAAALLIR